MYSICISCFVLEPVKEGTQVSTGVLIQVGGETRRLLICYKGQRKGDSMLVQWGNGVGFKGSKKKDSLVQEGTV